MELKRNSRHEWTIYTHHYDSENTYPELKQMDIIELDTVSVKRSYFPVIKAGVRIATTKLNLEQYHALVICCDGLGSFLTFRNDGQKAICLCFTPLRAAYDQEYKVRHLKKHRSLLPLALLFEGVYRIIDRLAWKRYRHVFCISNTVMKRVLDGNLCLPDKIEINYPGIDARKISLSERSENYFFLPGRIMWTKNIELAINAFIDFKKNLINDFRLIIAGVVDEKSRSYFEYLKRLSEGQDVTFILGPKDAEMEELYKRCYAVLFTSFNEDLGLTPLEGMTFGKPVIAVNKGGPTEIVIHEETGLLVDCEEQTFSRAMQFMAQHPSSATQMGKNGLVRCRNFTWDNFVEKIDKYIESMAEEAQP